MTGPRRTPDTNSMARATHPSTMAVPKSGCATISTPAQPVTRRSGPMIRRSGAPSSSRLVIRSAAKTVSASFINSDGWSRNWPKPTHLLEPCTWTPSPGTRTTSRSRKVMPSRSGAQSAEFAVVEADRQRERDDADRHPHALPDEDGPRTSIERDGDHRRGGTDHHQPDHAEQRDHDEEDRSGGELGHRGTQTRQGAAFGASGRPWLGEPWRSAPRSARTGRSPVAGGVTAVTPRPPARKSGPTPDS